MARLTCDVENFINYFLVYFRDIDSGEVWQQSIYNDTYSSASSLAVVRDLLRDNTVITFNGNGYDMPLIAMMLQGANNRELYFAGKDIIDNRLMPWDFERKYGVTIPQGDHIDTMNVAFGTASLKIYGARLGCKKLQELPIHHNNYISPDDVAVIDLYCGNDNEVTSDLFFDRERAINLRAEMSEQYGVDLRSKSDAQIAEHVIKSQYKIATGITLKAPKALSSYKYVAPSFVVFQGEQLQQLKATCESVDFNISDKGAVLMPPELNKQIQVAAKKYKMGIGGLHSVDAGASYYTANGYTLLAIDVTSYYPYIILNACFEPTHIGEMFTTIFRDIVERRVGAKPKAKALWKEIEAYKSCGEAVPDELQREFLKQDGIVESLKIVINGLFGKFGSRYSVVYSPDLMFHTTVTGQLCLFMLIEQFATSGIQVVSANTDGITLLVRDDMREHLDATVQWWEGLTNFNMEYEHYTSIHYRDVNNYIAVYEDGTTGGKGIFAKAGIRKNPANSIVAEACAAFVVNGVKPVITVTSCTDILKFLEVRKVAGGAIKDGVLLGGTVRWYLSDATDTPITYIKSGNKVAGSDCGMPMMELYDGLPCDLDINAYVEKADDVLVAIGVKFRAYMYNEHAPLMQIAHTSESRDELIEQGFVELSERKYNNRLKKQARLAAKLEH